LDWQGKGGGMSLSLGAKKGAGSKKPIAKPAASIFGADDDDE